MLAQLTLAHVQLLIRIRVHRLSTAFNFCFSLSNVDLPVQTSQHTFSHHWLVDLLSDQLPELEIFK